MLYKKFMVISVILLAFVSISATAQPIPPMPCRYDGFVRIDGAFLESGFVYATILNYQSAEAIIENGEYIGLAVAPPNGSYINKQVAFWIKTDEESGSIRANENNTFQSCINPPVKHLNLTASMPSPFCGNSICETGEDNSNCAIDCPVPPPSNGGTGGGGGGGGGGGSPPSQPRQQNQSQELQETVVTTACTESWMCTPWSENDCGTRTCTDSNNCNTQNSKPEESKECAPATTGETTTSTDKQLETEGSAATSITGMLVGSLKNPVVALVVLACIIVILYMVYRIARHKKFEFRKK